MLSPDILTHLPIPAKFIQQSHKSTSQIGRLVAQLKRDIHVPLFIGLSNKKGFIPDAIKLRKPGSFQILKPSIVLIRKVSSAAWLNWMIFRISNANRD